MAGNKTLRCGNDACRDFGIDRDIFVGDWFVDDPVLCPLCGELMDTIVPVATGPVFSPLGPAWPGPGRRQGHWK